MIKIVKDSKFYKIIAQTSYHVHEKTAFGLGKRLSLHSEEKDAISHFNRLEAIKKAEIKEAKKK